MKENLCDDLCKVINSWHKTTKTKQNKTKQNKTKQNKTKKNTLRTVSRKRKMFQVVNSVGVCVLEP